jgi:hypothetical protein
MFLLTDTLITIKIVVITVERKTLVPWTQVRNRRYFRELSVNSNYFFFQILCPNFEFKLLFCFKFYIQIVFQNEKIKKLKADGTAVTSVSIFFKFGTL